MIEKPEGIKNGQLMDTGNTTQDTRHRTQDTGHTTQDTGRRQTKPKHNTAHKIKKMRNTNPTENWGDLVCSRNSHCFD
jgi:hypothetical protein